MNEPTPLTPETVDALLSADLDGDLEAAARDLGLSASDARAQLRATPGADTRRAALTRARDLIAARPPVEASVEDRLVAAALRHGELARVRERRGRRERQWRILVATGSVAAAIAVIVGIVSLQSPGSSNSKASSAAPLTTERANAESGKAADGAKAPRTTSTRANLGDVTNANQLLLPARKLLAKAAPQYSSQSPTSPPLTPMPSDSVDDSANDKSVTAAAPACTTARLRDSTLPNRPALIASGTVANASVVILIYDGTGTPYAYVIRVSDCSLVAKLPLG